MYFFRVGNEISPSFGSFVALFAFRWTFMICRAKVYIKNIELNEFYLINVFKNYHITSLIVKILDNEYHVKTRQNCRHKIYVVFTLWIVPTTKYRIRRSQNRTARIKCSCNASLYTQCNVMYSYSNKIYWFEFTLAIEMVCCSIASWMATRSSSFILSNSSIQTTPPSANTIAPPSITKFRFKI